LVVGATSPDTARAIAEEASRLGVDGKVEYLGFVPEPVLEDEFARASIVVRWRPDGWAQGPGRYAVSGPLIRALARGCVVLTNDRRGALECLRQADAREIGDGQRGAEELGVALTEYVRDEDLRSAAAEAAVQHAAGHHSPDYVASRLKEQMG
jgi:glycosyltransferase involved in cell wall biosynthesis